MRTIIKKIILTGLLVVGISLSSNAQDMYGQSLGVRGGFLSGVTYKHFLDFAGAIEGIVGFNFENGRVTTLTGLYEQHFFLNYNTNLYAGGGLTLGFNSNDFRMIAEGIVGIEYLVPRFPISFSLDYKPAFNIFDTELYFNEFALSIRYIINQ